VSGLAAGALIYAKLHGGAAKDVTAAAAAPTTPSPPLASTPPPPTPSQPQRQQLIDVDVHVTPASASIEIDGATVTGNPFHGKYVEDGAMHQIRITAPGYQSRLAAVAFDNTVALTIDLERTPVARPAQVGTSHHRPTTTPLSVPVGPPPPVDVKPAPPPPPKPLEVDSKGGTRPHHEIDPNNPYGK
jgi:hypothetical protein